MQFFMQGLTTMLFLIKFIILTNMGMALASAAASVSLEY